jgi:hypothetical protein
MARLSLILCLFVASAIPDFGQITDGKLRKLYGPALATIFSVNSDIKITVNHGPRHAAGALTISGPLTAIQLEGIFDAILALSKRGHKQQDLEECNGGVCLRAATYDNAILSSAISSGGPKAEPSAYIRLRRKEGEATVSAIASKGFVIKTPKP